jgi:hypothetical protein
MITQEQLGNKKTSLAVINRKPEQAFKAASQPLGWWLWLNNIKFYMEAISVPKSTMSQDKFYTFPQTKLASLLTNDTSTTLIYNINSI